MTRALTLLLLLSPASAFARNAAPAPPVQSPTSASSGKVIAAESFPGPDLGARITAADAALGTSTGTITVNVPASLSSPVTLQPHHDLVVSAPVSQSATITLAGSNQVSCTGRGTVMSTLAVNAPAFTASRASAIHIHNCSFTMKNNASVLIADEVTDLSMQHLVVTGGSIAQIAPTHGNDPGSPSSNLDFEHNTLSDPPGTGGPGILLVNVNNATVSNNAFTGIANAAQWWGGDSAKGNFAQLTRTGKLTFNGNQCHNVVACIWGSMGHDITVSSNSADGCTDVCFDTEGGLNISFSANTATNCNNGCGAIFFFTRNVSFTGNNFSGDSRGGGLFLIKNQSANPASHTALTVSRNTFTCLTTCVAFHQEAVAQSIFEANIVTNGTFAGVGFGQNLTIARNQFSFTRALPANSAAIQGPSITGGTTLTIDGNIVSSSAPQGANSACISAVWNDFNNSDTYTLRNNHCNGPSPFPIDIVTETAGANPGPHAIWHVDNNFGAAGNIVHKRTTTNESYSATHNSGPSGRIDR